MMPGRLSIVLMIIIGLLANGNSLARDKRDGREGKHPGKSRQYDRDDRGRESVVIESPYSWPDFYYWPYYTFQPYYPSPSIIIPSRPPAYIDQGTVFNTETFGPNSWDYCSSPTGYYPYVQECPTGWQRIRPQPIEQQPGYWYYCTKPAGYYPYVRECSTVWRNVIP